MFAQKTRLQHERRGKEKREPQKSRAEAARFIVGGIEGEAEQHDDHQNKNNRGGQQFPAAKLRAEFLAEQCGGAGEQAHSGVGEGQDGAHFRARARVRNDESCIEANRASGEHGNF